MATYPPKKAIFTDGSGKPKYYERRGRFGPMGLKNGQRFKDGWALEKDCSNSYHRAGVGIDFFNGETKGAYSCLITGRNNYDQDTDSGDMVRFQKSKFKLANRAMDYSINSHEPVRLFSPEYEDGPSSFSPTRHMTFRGLFQVIRFEEASGVYLLRRI